MSIAMPAIAETPPTEIAPVSAAAAGGPNPGARATADPLLRRGADPAPVPVELQPVGHLQRGVPAEIHLRQREAPSGAMFLGSRVDDAVSLYYRRRLAGEQLDLDQVKDAYRELWQQGLEQETEKLGVDWSDIHSQAAFEMGLAALALTFEQLVPKLGEPVAVQRQLEFKLVPSLEWTILCYLDLEARGQTVTGEAIERVVDYKVKNSPISKPQADRDTQAGLYLTGRWLQGNPAEEFFFAQIAKPGPRRRQMSTALVPTTRTIGQMRATLARIALAASEIVATYERLGPERPWGFADPTSWKCSAKFCSAFGTCPGGAGL